MPVGNPELTGEAAMPHILTRAVILFILLAGPAQASAEACLSAARAAADRHGIPRDVLVALSLVETGRTRAGRFEPWAWTMNVAGRGFWFDSRAEAEAHARQTLATGQRSFDVGCFQLNYRWHAQNFASLSAMFDPVANADYAARYLLSHYAVTGNWPQAAGRYHSRTERFMRRYARRFVETLARLDTDDGPTRLATPAPAAAPPPQPPAPPPPDVQIAVRATGAVGLGPILRRASRPLIGGEG
ncbi:MAG: lytic transglycosylase domain-containing protein [Rubricella sp.]